MVRGSAVVPMLTSSSIIATLREISISRSNASCAHRSSVIASSPGSTSRVVVSIGDAYDSTVPPTLISKRGTMREEFAHPGVDLRGKGFELRLDLKKEKRTRSKIKTKMDLQKDKVASG